jgi:hypothetical protein
MLGDQEIGTGTETETETERERERDRERQGASLGRRISSPWRWYDEHGLMRQFPSPFLLFALQQVLSSLLSLIDTLSRMDGLLLCLS